MLTPTTERIGGVSFTPGRDRGGGRRRFGRPSWLRTLTTPAAIKRWLWRFWSCTALIITGKPMLDQSRASFSAEKGTLCSKLASAPPTPGNLRTKLLFEQFLSNVDMRPNADPRRLGTAVAVKGNVTRDSLAAGHHLCNYPHVVSAPCERRSHGPYAGAALSTRFVYKCRSHPVRIVHSALTREPGIF